MKISRRTLMGVFSFLFAIASFPFWVEATEPVVITARGRRIHFSSFVLDGHNDLPWAIRNQAASSFDNLDISLPQPSLHTDIPRLRMGNVGAQFWSVYVPANTADDGTAFLKTLEQIELVRTMVDRYPETFSLALSTADIRRSRRNSRIASMIGVEGGHAIENSIGKLRRLYSLGARYMTLTHSANLSWADSATDADEHQGLTPFGEAVVREMNHLGMLVDLSHVSEATMADALDVSRVPVIFSHSSARSIAPHPRNVPDSILRKLPANRGVVMVNFYSGFIHPASAQGRSSMFEVMRDFRARYPAESDYRAAMTRWRASNPILPGNVHDVVDHIDHIVHMAGIDHVGIGSDYDGVSLLPIQLEDVSTYPVITQELLNRGYSRRDIHRILCENALRVFAEAEAFSARHGTRSAEK